MKEKGGITKSGIITIFTTSLSFTINKIMQPEVNIPKTNHDLIESSDNPIQVYEVIRVIDGIPLFLEEHLERLNTSASLAGINNLPDLEEIENDIFKLISDKDRKIGNIKLSFKISGLHQEPICELDFIPHFYPTEDKYLTGVKLGLLTAERPNPQVKLQNLAIRNKANLLMARERVFEVLLVDHNGNITEGSRSNVFFVKEDQLFTSPDEKVLNGITRSKIIKLCVENDIPFFKKEIPLTGISEFEGAFLTGSSPRVLPISAIDKIRLNPSISIIKRLINLYDQEIVRYLDLQRAKNKYI